MRETPKLDDDWPIAFGSILGGDIEGRAWGRTIGRLELAARTLHAGIETPLRMNVIFHVDGPTAPNTFEGVRTGSFLRKKNLLIVQAAVFPKPGDDKRAVLIRLIWESLDVAEDFAQKKGIAERLSGLRKIVSRLETIDPDQVPLPAVEQELPRAQPPTVEASVAQREVEWSVRAVNSSGQSWDDPSEDALYLFLGDVERGDESFLIVERQRDPSGQTYIQSRRNADGSFVVERREGSATAHYATTVDDIGEAHALITSWAFELPELAPEVSWTRLRLDDGADG